MGPTTPQSGKKRQPTYTNDSILESLRDIGGGVARTVTKDLGSQMAHDALSSILGMTPQSGELKAGEAVSVHRKEAAPVHPMRRPETYRQIAPRLEEAKIKQQIEAVRAELKALAASLKNLHQEVEKAIDEVPVDPGIYHLNFLERLRGVIKVLQQQIEDSRTWLALWTNHKKQKHYWGLYKKHGTKFGLSSERTMATQAG